MSSSIKEQHQRIVGMLLREKRKQQMRLSWDTYWDTPQDPNVIKREFFVDYPLDEP